jgi:uncharacterized protein (DUF433 family)
VELAGVLANLSLPGVPRTSEPAYVPPPASKKQVRLRPEQVAALLVDYRAGELIVEITRRYGINKSTMFAHLARAGVSRERTSRALTGEQTAAIAAERSSGLTLAALACHYGVSIDTIRRALRRG